MQLDVEDESIETNSLEEPEAVEEETLRLEELENDILPSINDDLQLDKDEDTVISMDIASQKSTYDADIVFAKQNVLERKLFARILDDLGYTYVSIDNAEDLYKHIKDKRYKLALFDKGLANLNLKELSDTIRSGNSDISLVMLVDPSVENDPNDAMYVHEMIKNIINKDLLRLVFEKFI
jgi:CheY-like chemotaxis protein